MIVNAQGQTRKENPQVTEDMEDKLARFKIMMRRAELMGSLKEHPGWIAIQEILAEKLKSSERALDNFDKNEHRSNDLLMQERKNFKFFISIVDDFIASIPNFESAIERTEKELDARRKSVAV